GSLADPGPSNTIHARVSDTQHPCHVHSYGRPRDLQGQQCPGCCRTPAHGLARHVSDDRQRPSTVPDSRAQFHYLRAWKPMWLSGNAYATPPLSPDRGDTVEYATGFRLKGAAHPENAP